MCCHIFKDTAFVLVLLTKDGRARAEKKNATVSSFKDSRIFHEKEDLFHNTEFSDQKEQSPPPLKSRWCV